MEIAQVCEDGKRCERNEFGTFQLFPLHLRGSDRFQLEGAHIGIGIENTVIIGGGSRALGLFVVGNIEIKATGYTAIFAQTDQAPG